MQVQVAKLKGSDSPHVVLGELGSMLVVGNLDGQVKDVSFIAKTTVEKTFSAPLGDVLQQFEKAFPADLIKALTPETQKEAPQPVYSTDDAICPACGLRVKREMGQDVESCSGCGAKMQNESWFIKNELTVPDPPTFPLTGPELFGLFNVPTGMWTPDERSKMRSVLSLDKTEAIKTMSTLVGSEAKAHQMYERAAIAFS